jgi:hypothetical protein
MKVPVAAVHQTKVRVRGKDCIEIGVFIIMEGFQRMLGEFSR